MRFHFPRTVKFDLHNVAGPRGHTPVTTTRCPWLYFQSFGGSFLAASAILDSVLTLDALAIYAREGVEVAARWSVPKQNTITEYAYALLNDYDQQHGQEKICSLIGRT